MSDAGNSTTRVPAAVAPAETPGLNGLLSLAVAVVVVAALYFAREVLIPITVAVILSFMLAPLVVTPAALAPPPRRAVLLAVLVGLGILGIIGGIIGTQVAGIAQDIPQYAATIEAQGRGGPGHDARPPHGSDTAPRQADGPYAAGGAPKPRTGRAAERTGKPQLVEVQATADLRRANSRARCWRRSSIRFRRC